MDSLARNAEFYTRLARLHMAPLWETLHTLVTTVPDSSVLPHIWRYEDVRPYLMEAGALITAREAERRVLILNNPGLDGAAAATRSLYAGLQLVLPGDVAPAHRHTQNALRFIVEGADAFTSVNGDRVFMAPGDLVLTPGWHWHDHGNHSDRPMVWMDALDIPIVSFFDASFAERGEEEAQPVCRPAGDGARRFGNNLAPIDWLPTEPHSPVFAYPYERTRETLDVLAAGDAPDPCHGYKLRYVNPANGGHVTPTIAAFMQRLPAGFNGRPYRATDATIFSVVDGEGESRIGDIVVHWKPRDIFVQPSWSQIRHHAATEAVLFSCSDRAAQQALGLWREQRSDS